MSMPQEHKAKPLVEIGEVRVNTSLPQQEKLADYVRQVGNPYCYMDSGIVVKLSFTKQAVTLEDKLLSYLKRKI